jgi:YD repeat-containing protein
MRANQITLLALMALPLLSSPSIAQQKPRFFYDSNGNNIGSSMPAGQNTFYYGAQGQDLGTSMKAGNTTYYYDANGNSIGSSMGASPQE